MSEWGSAKWFPMRSFCIEKVGNAATPSAAKDAKNTNKTKFRVRRAAVIILVIVFVVFFVVVVFVVVVVVVVVLF